MKKELITFCVLLATSIPVLDAGGCGTTGGGDNSSSDSGYSQTAVDTTPPCDDAAYGSQCIDSDGRKVDTYQWKQDRATQQSDQQAQQKQADEQARQQQEQADEQARQQQQEQADEQARQQQEQADEQARQQQEQADEQARRQQNQ